MAAKSGFTYEDLSRMGPDALTRKRMLAEALLKQSSGIQDIRHPMQGLAQLAQALVGNIKEGRVDRAETRAKEGASAQWNDLAASMGMGGAFPEAPGGGQASAAPMDPASARVAQAHAVGGGDDIKSGIAQTASALGIDPIDLATAISYETAGTFDPTKAGPTTQHGQHRGLIQFGEPQAKQYGVDWNNPVGSQLGPDGAVAKYLRDTGVQPGMGLLDIYSAINAGGVGRYDRSDANNGGAPGTVADKVNNQMAGHRAKAMAMFGGGQTADASGALERMAQAGGQMTPEMVAQSYTQTQGLDPAKIAQALIAPNNRGDVAMPDGSAAQGAFPDAPMPAQQAPAQDWTPAAPIQAGGPDLARLMQAAGNEWMNPSQRGVIEALIGQKLTPPDPEADLKREKLRLEVDQMRNPQEKPTDDMRELDAINRERAAAGQPPLRLDEWITSRSKAGASNVDVTVGEGDKFYENLDKKNAEMFGALSETGVQARSKMAQIDRLDGLLASAPQGAVGALKQAAGEFGINTDGLDDIQSAQALINELVPQQRQPGSGPMSDADLALFKRSLPRVLNQPGGNQVIIGTMRGITQYQIAMGEIADAIADRSITPAEGRKKIRELPNPLADFGKTGSTKKAPITSGGYTIEEIED